MKVNPLDDIWYKIFHKSAFEDKFVRFLGIPRSVKLYLFGDYTGHMLKSQKWIQDLAPG